MLTVGWDNDAFVCGR